MAKRDRGTGHVWRPQGSKVYWCQYYINGQRQRESTGETQERKAINYLNKRLQEVAAGVRTINCDKVTVTELVEAKLTNERNNNYSGLSDQEARWRLYLQPFFGHMKASKVTTDLIDRYIAQRQQMEIIRRCKTKSGEIRTYNSGKFPDNGTINRELALLRGAFNLGRKSRKVISVPYFPMLKESNVRKGFLTDEQYERLAQECSKVGLWMRTLFEIAVSYAWRKSEVVTELRVSQIDISAKTIRLEPGTTKNDDAREVTIMGTLLPLIESCIEGKKPDDFVITREDGSQVKDFRGTWEKVTEAAGVPGLLFHDLRRTGARNLRRAGVAEGVIMKIGGWKTRSVFERYNIVAPSDTRDAMAKLEKQREEFSQRTAKVVQTEQVDKEVRLN